ncbi:MAG: penicillin-binding protein 2 [Deltaproteobacteria bacterium]|jgi:penicillin-binding protein 2|nr:penicillin-binding protein 2 [Deltaproteobacteria bacterium]
MSKYLKTVDSEWFRQRLTVVMLCVSMAALVLVLRLIFLQIIKGQEYRRMSLNNSIRLQSIDAPRGLIFDRNGNLLVDNRPSFDLYISLKDARPVEETLGRLAMHASLPQDELDERVAGVSGAAYYRPQLLKRDIGRDALAVVASHRYDLPGVDFQIQQLRNYINSGLAAHLLGYIGEINTKELQQDVYADSRPGDLVGKFGIEKSLESYLRGERGGRQVEVNANGQVVRVLQTVPAHSGYNVYLTIDRRLQQRAEELLQDQAGAVVALDPNSGEVLALASSPAFDQNDFITGLSRDKWNALINNPLRPLNNKAIQGEYPPASTYKILNALAGLQEGVINENDIIFCPGHYRFGNRSYRCWRRGGHGSVDLNKALAESCDVYFYQVGQRLGIDRLAWYAKAAGLGAKTGIELDHEGKGLVPTADWKKRRFGIAWQPGETLSVAIGQGFNLVTPLQMAVFTAAVANGGVRYRPTLVKRVVSGEGDEILDSTPRVVGRLPVSAANLALVKKGLWEVVQGQHGTARIARLKDTDISGKTGTAQVVGREKLEESEEGATVRKYMDHAWFVAYAPSEAPQIAIAVIVEHGEHGSSAAAPVARELVKTYLEGTPSEPVVAADAGDLGHG